MTRLRGQPRRIVLILPCCIGDVILATATLAALRRAWPEAHITWAVGGWSKPVIEHHPMLDAVLETGPAALPVKSPAGFLRFVQQIRAGHFDLAVSLVRSPLMSLAVKLSGIPTRAGLDSAGRGLGYNVRARIDPRAIRHEAEIYLDVTRALGLDTSGCHASVPVDDALWPGLAAKLTDKHFDPENYILINPCGGRNPGMTMDAKRWPAVHYATLADRLAARLKAQVILLGGPGDTDLLNGVSSQMTTQAITLAGALSFPEIALLARRARLYVGNDTGLTHLAAAAGAPTAAIFGPSDPRRYTPFSPNVLALWKPAPLKQEGVAAGTPDGWDWARDGISVDEADRQISAFLQQARS